MCSGDLWKVWSIHIHCQTALRRRSHYNSLWPVCHFYSTFISVSKQMAALQSQGLLEVSSPGEFFLVTVALSLLWRDQLIFPLIVHSALRCLCMWFSTKADTGSDMRTCTVPYLQTAQWQQLCTSQNSWLGKKGWCLSQIKKPEKLICKTLSRLVASTWYIRTVTTKWSHIRAIDKS